MDSLLKKKLQTKGAVLIEGSKWCGKGRLYLNCGMQ